MSLRKQLQKAYDIGESDALAGRQSLPDHLGIYGVGKFTRACYEAGYDKGRTEFIRLAKEYQKAARVK